VVVDGGVDEGTEYQRSISVAHVKYLQATSIGALTGILLAGSAGAQDLDPRRYVNLPIGQNYLAAAYSYSEGDVAASPSIPLEDAFLRIDGPAVIYARTFALAGNSASFDAFLPYVCASGRALLDGEPKSRSICGRGDTQLRVNYNFIGSPAVELSNFAKRKKGVVMGASLQLSLPTGQYDNDKLLNIGANRWYIKPEIGMSIPWRNWSFEFAAGVRLFTNNNDYVGGVQLKQDPLYNLQAHLIYDLTPRQWVSLNTNYFFGGETYQDDVPSATRQENSRLGLTWTMALNSQHFLKFLANTGVITRIGNDSDAYTVAWTYRWD
jgi:hypothetical protein